MNKVQIAKCQKVICNSYIVLHIGWAQPDTNVQDNTPGRDITVIQPVTQATSLQKRDMSNILICCLGNGLYLFSNMHSDCIRTMNLFSQYCGICFRGVIQVTTVFVSLPMEQSIPIYKTTSSLPPPGIYMIIYQSHAQTPLSSHEKKRSGVTSPNHWASSRSMERPIKSQSNVYWNNEEARTSILILPLKVCYEIHYPTLTNL